MARTLDGIPLALWYLVRLAAHRMLILDYDGTIAPFRADRKEALPDTRCYELVNAMSKSTHTSVAVISGRPVSELEGLMAGLPIVYVGEHGWEYRIPGQPRKSWPLPPEVDELLDRAEQTALELGWSAILERKRACMTLHTRSMAAEKAKRIEDQGLSAWLPLAERGQVRVDRIDGGVELRACGRDPGTAVFWLLSHFRQAALGAYVGDEIGDESAFTAISGFGFGIRVGENDRPTNAQGRLKDQSAVGDFLDEWLHIVTES